MDIFCKYCEIVESDHSNIVLKNWFLPWSIVMYGCNDHLRFIKTVAKSEIFSLKTQSFLFQFAIIELSKVQLIFSMQKNSL